ncbi:zinc finger, CCHC-type containing protein [Tanacetum coccineum]
MGDANPIRTLGDYSKPSHEGYRNTIDLPVGNNVVPLRSNTIRLVQNGCSFHGLRFENPNQHLKDFLKLVDSLDLDGSITTWEDLTTYFLAQFFPPRRTAKLHNDILMFQQHHGESLSEALTCFKDLLQKCEIDRAADNKRRDKNTDESWEIIENLALYDHEGWNDTKEFIKLVKAISTPQSTSKTPDLRLLELEDQINFLLKGSRSTPRPSSTHIPRAYAEAVYSNPRPQNQNKPPRQNPFTFHERTGPNPQPQALGTTFEARVQDYMAAHTKRMERFENAIFKQHEEINDKMTKMFGLLKELTTNRAPEKVLIREEAKFPVTKNVYSISLTREEEERSKKTDVTTGDDIKKPTKTKTEMPVKKAEKEDEAENEPNRKARK